MRLAPALAGILVTALAATAVAGPVPPATSATTDGPLTRYQNRLEADAFRVLSPEVLGASKDGLAAHRAEMGGARSVTEWQSLLLSYAPGLEKASKVLVRRTEVIWTEERVADPYASSILQQAAIGALQRGLVRVLAQFGIPIAPGRDAPASRPAAVSTPVAKRPAPPPAAAAPVGSSARSTPAAFLAYRTSLDGEAFRILTPEMLAGTPRAIAARRRDLQAAPTVAQWTAILLQAAPSCDKACRVLARRTEVRCSQDGLIDPYESLEVQRAAVLGLEAGLERILAQFGV